MTATFAIVKRLLASNKISFIITALVVLCATSSGDVVLSNGNYTWLLYRLSYQLWHFGVWYLVCQHNDPFAD